MAGSENMPDLPDLPQRRGQKDPADLPDEFGPIAPLPRMNKAPAARRQLPRAATPPSPDAPVTARPAPERPVMGDPAPHQEQHSRVPAAAIAAAVVVLIVVAIVLLATS